MTKYVYSEEEARHISKHGIDLTLYGPINKDIDFKRISVKEGHFEEFKNTSWFIYYILQGNGIFVLNDEQIEVKQGDIVSIPPNTRIHYFGKLELTLIVTPPWKAENETHIRIIDTSENPDNS
jgi:mannose-6-phosphate isomerase-like protein (cupin superfamily)